jgi:hypothetical protein
MKWESVTSTLGYSEYALSDNGNKLVTLVFNFSSHAARIEYADEKRVFLMRKEGFLKNRTVLRNEYGFKIGYVGTENNEDFIVLDNERFFYSIDNKDIPVVTIYKESKDQPLAVCELAVEKSTRLSAFSKDKLVRDDAHYSLLLTLCWYLFHPAKNERQLEVA